MSDKLKCPFCKQELRSFNGNIVLAEYMFATTYLSDNETTVFLGQKGAIVEFNQPLPAGFMITIKEKLNQKGVSDDVLWRTKNR